MASIKSVPSMFGLSAAKLPVRDLKVTRGWYARVFGWESVVEFPDENGVIVGAGGNLPGRSPAGLAFRANPAAVTQEGLELRIDVDTKEDLQRWVEHLERENVRHSGVIDATISWLVVLHDPDGHEIHLMTRERHGIDQGGRRGYGRLVPGRDLPGA